MIGLQYCSPSMPLFHVIRILQFRKALIKRNNPPDELLALDKNKLGQQAAKPKKVYDLDT